MKHKKMRTLFLCLLILGSFGGCHVASCTCLFPLVIVVKPLETVQQDEWIKPWLNWNCRSNIPGFENPSLCENDAPVTATVQEGMPEVLMILATPFLTTEQGCLLELSPLGCVGPIDTIQGAELVLEADLQGGASAVLAARIKPAGIYGFNLLRADQVIREKGLDSLVLDYDRFFDALVKGECSVRDFAARRKVEGTVVFDGETGISEMLLHRNWLDARLVPWQRELYEGINLLVATKPGADGVLDVLVLDVRQDGASVFHVCGKLEKCVKVDKKIPGTMGFRGLET